MLEIVRKSSKVPTIVGPQDALRPGNVLGFFLRLLVGKSNWLPPVHVEVDSLALIVGRGADG